MPPNSATSSTPTETLTGLLTNAWTRFIGLFRDPELLAGEDPLVALHDDLGAGLERSLDLELAPETEAIGAVAAFRELEGAVWRSHVELPRFRSTGDLLVLDLQANTLNAELTSK